MNSGAWASGLASQPTAGPYWNLFPLGENPHGLSIPCFLWTEAVLHGKDMGKPMPYMPPSFAIAYNPSQAGHRKIGHFVDGYWWVELGSEYDIIADQETNRHKLMGYLHGVWDHIKNHCTHSDEAAGFGYVPPTHPLYVVFVW